MTHGPQRGLFDLIFRVPARCADMLAAGEADIGIVPSFELLRQPLAQIRGVGIACRGPVRSILLICKVAPERVRVLAADVCSRTSVALARLILEGRYGAEVEVRSEEPVLEDMLKSADAALIIGDSALQIDPAALPYRVCDLGREWFEWTGLPMVFAVWAGRPAVITAETGEAFRASLRFGLQNLEEIVRLEAPPRGLSIDAARKYLKDHIVSELGEREYEGMSRFLQLASALPQRVLLK